VSLTQGGGQYYPPPRATRQFFETFLEIRARSFPLIHYMPYKRKRPFIPNKRRNVRRRRSYKRAGGRKRRPRHRTTGRRSSTTVPRLLQTDSLYVRLPFQDSRTSTTVTGFPWSAQYNLNGLFDVYGTGLGGNVNGLNRYATFFTHYTVYGAAVDWCAIVHTNEAYGVPQMATIGMASVYPRDVNWQSVYELFEQPQYHKKCLLVPPINTAQEPIDPLSPDDGTKVGATVPSRIIRMKKYYSIKKIVGRPFRQDADKFSALPTSNPINLVPLYLRVVDPLSLLAPIGFKVQYTLKFTFYVKFYGRKFNSI